MYLNFSFNQDKNKSYSVSDFSVLVIKKILLMVFAQSEGCSMVSCRQSTTEFSNRYKFY